jgi:thiamine pyrophosphate-dependent acetolactate synthase large subunit-like protein
MTNQYLIGFQPYRRRYQRPYHYQRCDVKPCDVSYQSTQPVGQLIVNKIIAHNGKGSRIYGVPGAGWYLENQYIQDAIDKDDIDYINATDETSAVFMAAYDSEVTTSPQNEQVGVAFCTTGPGLAVAVNAIANASRETKSVVIFLGFANNTNFQFIDTSLAESITHKVLRITDKTVNPGQIIDDAFYIAKFGTTENPCRGPVAVFVDKTAWDLPYLYSNCITKYRRQIDYKGIYSIIHKICYSINPYSLIIIRISERVNIDVIKRLAEFAEVYKNIYIHLTYTSKPYLDFYDYQNVGYEGPKTLAAPCIVDQYKKADIVIDIANEIELSTILVTDIVDLLPENAKIFFVLSQTLGYKPKGSNKYNTITTDPNIFSNALMWRLNACMPKIERIWPSERELENSQLIQLMQNYKQQKNPETGVLTEASFACQILWCIYAMQPYNTGVEDDKFKLVIDDENLYSYDIGSCSFITGAFIYTKLVNYELPFSEYSSIGTSLPAAAGRIWSKKYDSGDIIEFIGDGGWFNLSQSFLNLFNSVSSNPSQRCLFIFMNDNSYTNVADGERKVFGYSTQVTSTIPIQNNINIIESLQCLIGSKCRKTLILGDMYEESVELKDFITKWYKKEGDFSQGGFYFVEYKTISGYPRFEPLDA